MSKPSAEDLNAARTVLFEPSRQQRMTEDAQSIDVLLNVGNASPGRVVQWQVSSGKLSATAREAVSRCRDIAASYHEMHREMAVATVNSKDKGSIMEVLGYLSGGWSARADAWEDEKPPSDPTGLARSINAHFVNAFDVAASVAEYFRPGEK